MNLEQELSKAIRAVLREAWPEATTNGFYSVKQIARTSLERLAPKTPFVAISMVLEDAEEWGLVVRTKSGPVSIYYVTDEGLHEEDDLLPKLEALRALLWPAAGDPAVLTFGQVLSDPDVSISEDLSLNRHFQTTTKPFQAGAVIAEILVGEAL